MTTHESIEPDGFPKYNKT